MIGSGSPTSSRCRASSTTPTIVSGERAGPSSSCRPSGEEEPQTCDASVRLTTATAGILRACSATASRRAHLLRDEQPLVVFVVIVVDAQRGRLALADDAEDSSGCLPGRHRIGLDATARQSSLLLLLLEL